MKKFLSFILAICMIIPCLIGLSACEIKIETVNICFNRNGGTWSDSYIASNTVSSKKSNLIKPVNPELFENFTLPSGKDMDAPKGKNKIFAGWYFDEDCAIDSNWTKENWDNAVEKAKSEDKKSIYLNAKWVEEGNAVISFNTKLGFEFNSDYLTAHQTVYELNLTDYETVKNNFPTGSDIKNAPDKTFIGWYLDSECSEGNELTVENIKKYISDNTEAYVVAYAKWGDRDICYLEFNLWGLNEVYPNLTFTKEYLDKKAEVPSWVNDSDNDIYRLVYIDELDTMTDAEFLSLAPTLQDIVKPAEFNYVIKGYEVAFAGGNKPFTRENLKSERLSYTTFMYVEIIWEEVA